MSKQSVVVVAAAAVALFAVGLRAVGPVQAQQSRAPSTAWSKCIQLRDRDTVEVQLPQGAAADLLITDIVLGVAGSDTAVALTLTAGDETLVAVRSNTQFQTGVVVPRGATLKATLSTNASMAQVTLCGRALSAQ